MNYLGEMISGVQKYLSRLENLKVEQDSSKILKALRW